MPRRIHFNKGSYGRNVQDINNQYDSFIEGLIRQRALEEVLEDKALNSGDEKQLNKAVDDWIEKNAGRIEELKREYKNSLALVKYNEIDDVISSASSTKILGSIMNEPRPKRTQASMKLDQAYGKKIGQDFFEYLNQVSSAGTKKVQTGSELISNVINLDGQLLYQHTGKYLKTTPENLIHAHENIRRAGKFMAFDLETLGGRDATGQQALDFVTEFAFGEIDASTGNMSQNNFFGSIIGVEKGTKVYENIESVINEIEERGYVSERHRVIGDRLALTGHKKTKIKEVEGKKGIFEFVDFAHEQDLKTVDGNIIETMRRGLQRYAEVGASQAAHKIDFQGHKIYAWEGELFNAISKIHGKEGLTSVGYNSANFDIPMLKRMLNSNQMSSEGKQLFKKMGFDNLDWQENHLDLFAGLQVSSLSNNKTGLFTEAERRNILKAEVLTSFQQESLVRKFHPDFYDGKVAHVGRVDIQGLGKLVSDATKMPDQEGSFLDHVIDNIGGFNIKSPLQGDQRQLFYAKESIGIGYSDKSRVMSFVEDMFSGELRTFGGVAVKGGNITREAFGQHGIQRGVSYTVDSITGLDMSDQWIEEIADVHPALARKDILAVRLTPQSNAEHSFKSLSSTVLVGTPEEVMESINKSLIHTHTADKDGVFQPLAGEAGEEVSKLMGKYKIKDGQIETTGHSLEEQLAESTFRIKNESAARARRERSVKREKGMLSMLEDMRQEADRRGVEFDEKTRKLFLDEISEKSTDMARGVTKRDMSHSSESILKTFQEYQGWKSKDGARIYRETVDAVMASTEYSESTRDVTQAFLSAAEDRAGSNANAQDFYLKQYFDTLYSSLQETGMPLDQAVNNEEFFVRQADLNKFDIDVTDLITSPKIDTPSLLDPSENILTINLDSPGTSLAGRIREMRGERPFVSEIEELKELKLLADHVGAENVDISNDTIEVASDKIVSHLKAVRENNFMEGRIRDTKRMNVLKASPLEELSEDYIQKVIDQANETMPTYLDLNSGHASTITDMLFDNVTESDLLSAGYSKDQAKTLLDFRSLRRRDTQTFVEDFISGVESSGGSLLLDEKSKEVILLAQGQQMPLRNLPRDVFEDGRFYTRVGRNRVAPAAGIYADRRGNLGLGTLIGKAHESGYGYAANVLPSRAKDGELVEAAGRYLDNFAKVIREAPEVFAGDRQDARSGFLFNVNDVIEQLYDLNEQGVFDDTVFTDESKMRKILGQPSLATGRIKFHDEKMIYENINPILETIAKEMGDERALEYARRLTFSNKNTEGHMGTVDNMPGITAMYSDDTRGIENQEARSVMFNEELARERISSSRYLRDVSLGQSVYDPKGYSDSRRVLSGTSHTSNTHITARALSISDRDFRTIVNQADFADERVRDALSKVHLNEGAAIGNPALVNEIFTARNAIQKINIQKMADLNLDNLEEINRRTKMAPRISVEPDGTISFKYGSGEFVSREDQILSIKGLKGKAPAVVDAKYDGMFNMGVFTRTQGLLVDEADIVSTLNENRERIVGAIDPTKEAYRTLEDVYDLDFYINPIDASMHRKVAVTGLEKNTVTHLADGLGSSGDERIVSAIEALGLSGRRGTILNRSYFDSLDSDDIANTDLGRLIAHETGEAMSHERIVGAIRTSAGVSPGEFKELLQDEQMGTWNALVGTLRDQGLIREDETIQYVMDNRAAFAKHADASGYIREVATQLRSELGDEEAFEVLSQVIPEAQLTDSGSIVIPGGKIDVDGLSAIVEDYGLSTTRKLESGIQYEVSDKSISYMSSHYDLGPSSYLIDKNNRVSKAMRLTDRHMLMMRMDTYDKETLERTREELGEETFNRVFGHAIDYDANGELLVREAYEGKPLLGDAIEELQAGRLRRFGASPDDALIVQDGNLVDNRFTRERLADLSEQGVNLSPTVQWLQGEGFDDISLSAAEEFHSASLMEVARNWNRGDMISPDGLRNMGFQDFELGNIELTPGGNENFVEAGFEKSMLVDLHIPELGSNQIYRTDAERYLAVPYEPQKYYSGEEARSQVQSRLSLLQRKRSELIESINEGELGLGSAHTAESAEKMREIVGDIKSEISTNLTGKKKAIANLSTVYLSDQFRATGSGHQLYGNETSEALKALEFDGHNLVESAAEGLEYDYGFAGREYFEKTLLSEEHLSRTGISREDMEKHLQTKGSLQLAVREPNDYKRSTSFANIYLDNTISGDKIQFSASMTEAKGGDYDGDQFATAQVKARATIIEEGKAPRRDKIDYATYQLMRDQGIQVELESPDTFRGAIASVHLNAVENKFYSVREEVDKYHDSLDNFIAKQYAIAGDLHPKVFEAIPTSEMSSRLKDYESINNALIEQTGLSRNALLTSTEYRSLASDYIESITIDDPTRRQEMIESLALGVQRQADFLERGVKASKLAAGESNFFVHNMKRTVDIMRQTEGIDISNREADAVQQVSLAIQEAFLAPKNVTSVDEDMIENFKYATQAMFGDSGVEKDTNKMVEFLTDAISDRKELKLLESEGMSIEDQIQAFANLGNKAQRSPYLNRFLRQAITDKGLSPSENLITSGSDVDMIDTTIRQVNDYLKDQEMHTSIQTADLVKGPKNAYENATNFLESGYRPPKDPKLSKVAGDLVENVQTKFSRSGIRGKDLAFGALGIAGAVMVAGFVGGNPSEPATTQAANQEDGLYDVPSMVDEDLSVVPNAGGGYIVNIRADSKRGKRHVEEAIQQAMAQSYQSTNINVSMNIRDSTGNITDRNIEDIIRGSFA